MSNYYVLQSSADPDPTAWIALLVAAASLAWTMWNELSGYRRKQADEYWYRNVFSPNCIEPLVDLLNTHLGVLRGLDVALVQEADLQAKLDAFAKEKERVLGRLWISQMFSNSFYEFASGELDGLEDNVAQQFAAWSFDRGKRTDESVETLQTDAINRTTAVLVAASKISLSRFGSARKKNAIRRKIRAFYEA